MRNLRQDVIRVGIAIAISVTQIGATPQKEPYVTSWYLHAQRLVDVGGRRLNILCMGTGSPVVVLDAGLGNGLSSWRYVQRSIAHHTRVCSYDRAGMGFSEPARSARDADAIFNDLHALLHGAGVAPPYVLVGHSIAGLYDLLYTDRHTSYVINVAAER
jgi:pimeloyl-ACP methyl ester carboxylesterase